MTTTTNTNGVIAAAAQTKPQEAPAKATPAQMVDHVRPINEGGAALDLENLQSLCHACHNRKSGRERHRNR